MPEASHHRPDDEHNPDHAASMRINDALRRESSESRHWSDVAADKVLERFPNEACYTCAAGISPSGVVHFGNFRDVMTSYAVYQSLRQRGAPARLLFSWDNFDRFRKVPVDLDASFQQYVGMPLSSVPDPEGEYASYAERYQQEFMQAMTVLGIDMEYRSQTDEYRSGRYDEAMIHALQQRESIGRTLLSFMSEKAKAEKGIEEATFLRDYYPISVYSRFTGNDNTDVVEYDGEGVIRYICHGTNQTDEVDFRETHNAKLAWKIDWPMRWAAEGVNFEPGGHDHATPGGSYDTSFEIAKNIFGRLGPVFVGYEFIGLRGMSGKMSGSKGGAVSPSDLLQIYTPELLKWLYLRRLPTQKFELAFDASVFRDYTEMDRMVGDYDKLREGEKRIIAQSLGHAPTQVNREAVPFQTAVSVGQIVHWNRAQFEHALGRINQKASTTSIDQRLPRARHWLEAYNPDQAVSLLPSPNIDYIKHLTPEQREQICDLVAILQNEGVASIDALQQTLYAIPKSLHFSDEQNRQRQRTFFVALYQLLIGKDTGPRLATFIAAADDLKKILALLSLEG